MGADILQLRRLGQTVQLHITEDVMVETVDEQVSVRTAGTDVPVIAADAGIEAFRGFIGESRQRRMTFRECWEADLEERIDDAAEVHPPAAIPHLLDGRGLHRFLDATGLAHLHRRSDAVNRNHVHRAPFRLGSGHDALAAKTVRLPGSKVRVSAPGAFPG